ncbi:hypothetical protein NP493_1755g00038 [Ridgeia piscesae]|uniref:Uncharacterized protein n=1 Tax=Ridgeia piscesae TaxID=27915 RepID=A0AAD9JV25_RIDPI|nr:hypothetical protein NP493_1755g00038 [Ridgeia piscesae]
MYLPTKMFSKSAIYRGFTWWIHGRLGRRVQRVIPNVYQPKMEFPVLSAENKIWDNTQHLLTAALTNYQLICK